MAKTQTPVTLVASQAKPAATVLRGTADVRSSGGGFLTMLISNGATAPTNAGGVIGRVLLAHSAASMPAAAGPGADWKLTPVQISGGNVNSATGQPIPLLFQFGPALAFIEVEFLAHIGNDVTVEAFLTYFQDA